MEMETSTVMSKGTKKVSNEPSNRRSRTPSSAPGYYAMVCSQRLTLAIVGFFGCLITFALRTDLSFAIVCMVNETAINVASGTSGHKHSMCLTDNQTEKIKEQHPKKNGGNLPWTKQDQGYVLSSYFWGYVSSQILSGYLAGKFGGRLIFGLSTFFGSIVTLASPFVASTDIHIFVILRGILGFVQGSLFPAFHTLWSAWSPPMERSILTGITYAGTQMGIFVTMPLSGLMCVYGFAGGWPSIFYLLGTAGIIFTVIWYFTAFDSPHVHPRISREEFVYIRSSMEENVEKRTRKEVAIPWIPMITSIPVWAIFIGHFCGDFGAYMMMTNLPLFMNDVLGFDQARMGLFAGIPYLLYAVVINLGGIAADKLRKSETLSTTGVRRLAMILGLGSQAVFLVACAYCQCGQENLVVTFLTLGIGLSGVQFAGYCVNYIDVAPHFAGTLVGIGNMLGGVAGIICPLLVGWLVKEGTREEWKIVFWITGVVLILGAMIFSIFCDGKVQSWARIEKAENKEASENLV